MYTLSDSLICKQMVKRVQQLQEHTAKVKCSVRITVTADLCSSQCPTCPETGGRGSLTKDLDFGCTVFTKPLRMLSLV